MRDKISDFKSLTKELIHHFQNLDMTQETMRECILNSGGPISFRAGYSTYGNHGNFSLSIYAMRVGFENVKMTEGALWWKRTRFEPVTTFANIPTIKGLGPFFKISTGEDAGVELLDPPLLRKLIDLLNEGIEKDNASEQEQTTIGLEKEEREKYERELREARFNDLEKYVFEYLEAPFPN